MEFAAGLVTTEGVTRVTKIQAKNLESATKKAGKILIGYFADRKIEPGKIWCKNGLRVSVIVDEIES